MTKTPLFTETNTRAVERKVMAASKAKLNRTHRRLNVDFEHGQWWTTCLACGAQWSVVDTNNGFDFERVSDSDESCLYGDGE